MPAKPLPYFPNLMGYALPVVTEAIDKLGPPGEIKKIPMEQEGPLLVTLAVQLASILTQIILERFRAGHVSPALADLTETHGGEKYQVLLRTLEETRSNWEELELEVREQEWFVVSRGLAKSTVGGWENRRATEKSLRHHLIWMKTPNRPLAGNAKKKYEAASEKCRELAERCDQLRYKERILRKKIESSPGYLQAKEKIVNEQLVSKNRRGVTVEGSIQISLEAANLLADGIGYYVKNTDGKWWRAFAEWVEHRVAVDYRLLPARFVLRDPIIVAAIDAAVVEKKVTLEGATTIVLSEPWLVPGAANGPQFDLSIADAIDAAVVEKKMTLEEATAGVLSEPWLVRRAANWPQLTLKDEDVGGTRFKLRREDKLACEWIWTRSGKKHPLDPYRVWHTSVGRHGLADQAGITEDYRPERAINELLWCLSRSDPKHFPFVGEFSREYPVELWAKRVAKWQNDPPDYFAHEDGRKVI